MSDDIVSHGLNGANANGSAGNSADLYGNKVANVLTPKPDNGFGNPNKTGPKFVPEKFNYRRVGTAPVNAPDFEKPGSW
jgi:hypothetical protein